MTVPRDLIRENNDAIRIEQLLHRIQQLERENTILKERNEELCEMSLRLNGIIYKPIFTESDDHLGEKELIKQWKNEHGM